MRELALHILDIIQNSLRAGAKLIEVEIVEDTRLDTLMVLIRDDGSGMDEVLLERVIDPFTTTRTTRKVGLGIPLMKMAAESAAGDFTIDSRLGEGTVVKATFVHSHIDRMPLGNMADTISTVIAGNPTVDLVYRHRINDDVSGLDTRLLKAEVGEEALTVPSVIEWVKIYLKEGSSYLMEV
ncbi:MAG: sensor histidine kinase [Firmicutes bacterium]|nr:sensor histidine kinase [Bacillota bacterium]